LIIDPTGNIPLTVGEDIQVIGEVQRFLITEIEQDYDITWDGDIRRELEAEYEGEPVIFATSTQVLEEPIE
jgi:hypothetical protein